MREDNHEKRMFYKFIFLLVVALLIAVVFVWRWTTDDPKNQSPEEMFTESKQQKSTEEPDGLDEDKINTALKEEGDMQTEAKEKNRQSEPTEKNRDKVDLEQKYINQYGAKEVEQAKGQAKKVLALYLLQVKNWNKWRGAVTPSYLDKMKKEMTDFKDEKVKRDLDKIELFASQPSNNEEITYGAFATWHVLIKGKSTSKPMQLYYITLQKKSGNWKVSDMVTPKNQNMEGEGKEKK